MNRTRGLRVGIGTMMCLLAAPFLDEAAAARPASARTAVEPCFSAGELDLNGDGFTDAVVGDPEATVAGQPQAGRIVVLYGDGDGRIGEGARAVLTQADLGLPVEAGDQFGSSVATTQVDMDSCADVVVGAPGEDLSGQADAGSIHVVFGSTAGLNGDVAGVTLSQADIAGAVEPGDRFGATVAAGSNLGQDNSVVAAGAPGEDVGATATSAGVVNLVQFSDSIPVTPRQIGQNSSGVPGTAEDSDRFGAAVVFGFDVERKDHGWELLVGAPGEALGSRASAGSLTVLPEAQGFPPATWLGASYTQDSPGVPGAAEAGDQFAASLAATTTNFQSSTSIRRLAVGAPGEDVGGDNGAGLVNLFTASGSGLVPKSALTQDTAGVAGASEPGDQFGRSVAVTSGTSNQFVVGVPNENIGSAADAGMAHLFSFANLAADVPLTQDTPGAAGTVQAGNRYGSPVVAIEGESERAFAIGNPYNGTGTVHVETLTSEFDSRSWVPGLGGVPTGATRFGWAVGGHDNLH
jgi:hypothetical protein